MNCNNPHTVKLTDNPEYNLFFEYVKGIVYLRGNHKLIKLSESRNKGHHDLNLSDESEQEYKCNITADMFKFIGYYSDIRDLHHIHNLADLSIAIVNRPVHNTVEFFIYVIYVYLYRFRFGTFAIFYIPPGGLVWNLWMLFLGMGGV